MTWDVCTNLNWCRISSINSIMAGADFFEGSLGSWHLAYIPQQIHGCKTNGGTCIWPNYKKITNLEFPEIRDFSLLKHHLGWGRIFGPYNLTKCVYIQTNIKPEIWTDKQKITSPSIHQCHHLQIGHVHMGSKNWVQHKHCRTGTWKIWRGHCWLGDHFPFEKAALFFWGCVRFREGNRIIPTYLAEPKCRKKCLVPNQT